jgi:hypothetical protein
LFLICAVKIPLVSLDIAGSYSLCIFLKSVLHLSLILTRLSLLSLGPGDLFIDGKVIHRPQFQFTERQQVRSRPRPRYDRRRETMQVERRETMQRGPSTLQQRPQFSQEPTQNPEQHYEPRHQ